MPFYRPWAERLERAVIRLAVAMAAMVIIVQVLLSLDLVEQPAAPVFSQEAAQWGWNNRREVLQAPAVTFRLKSFSVLPLARVLVNGEPMGEFRDRYATVFVQEGDLLEVDGTLYGRPFEVEILDVSKEVIFPATGTSFRVEGGAVCPVGKVRMKGR